MQEPSSGFQLSEKSPSRTESELSNRQTEETLPIHTQMLLARFFVEHHAETLRKPWQNVIISLFDRQHNI